MKFLVALFLFSSQTGFAIDVGNGQDGTCDVTGVAQTQITSAKRDYQCTTLTINGNLDAFSGAILVTGGGAPLVIKVQGNVSIDAGATIDMTGVDGVVGNTTNSLKAGGKAGAGGTNGGASPGISSNGGDATGAGKGTGGDYVPTTGLAVNAYGGGGGAGASFDIATVTAASDGEDVGNGPNLNSAGDSGVAFGTTATFESTFSGGSGGGAGGAGVQASVQSTGSSGGGGGGALRIIAGGNIIVDGTILVDAGKGGGNAADVISGGGGGAGGAVWLQAAGSLTVNAGATISALGGAGGTNFSGGFSGGGGHGGDGGIRLDDGDGVVSTVGASVTPASFSTVFTPTPLSTSSGTSAISRQYSSSISCARINDESVHTQWTNLLVGFCFSFLLYGFSRRGKV